VFGRTKKPQPGADATVAVVKEGGKGRPTPSRKEAETAARERARAGMDKKAAQRLLRERRTAENRKMRAGLKTGDERYLPARDQGPVKRAVRDYVDSRLSVAEFLLPMLVLIMVLSYTNPVIGNDLWILTVLLVLVDTAWMLIRLRRALRERFPDDNLKGVNSYAVLRVIQMRFMRVPKAKVGLGGKPR
jgi:hypothetical protein